MSQIDDLNTLLADASKALDTLRGCAMAMSVNRDFASVMELYLQQTQLIQELRDEVARLRDVNRAIEKERDEFESKWRWHFYDEDLEPEHIRDFLVDIGIEPAQVNKLSLGDRMAIAQAVEAAKVFG